jgi:osmotically-inducible protein OsmY
MKARYLITALALLTAMTAAADLDQKTEDAAITARVETMFLLNQHLNPFNINTNTREGVVTLVGSVNDEVQKDLAGELAASADGVKSVNNEIIVSPNTYGEKERRKFGQKVKDQTTTASVRARLLYHREFKGLQIGVETINGVVRLHGVVKSDPQRRRIEEVTRETRGVIDVINDLVLRNRDPLEAPRPLGQSISDEWLEKRVETQLLLNRHLSIRELDVEVNEGVVILTGSVNEDRERVLATNLAQSIQGVNEVRNEISLRDPTAPLYTEPVDPPVLEGSDPEEDVSVEELPTVEARPL